METVPQGRRGTESVLPESGVSAMENVLPGLLAMESVLLGLLATESVLLGLLATESVLLGLLAMESVLRRHHATEIGLEAGSGNRSAPERMPSVLSFEKML